MKTEQLLEHRAERGVSRGANSVWNEAQTTRRSPETSRHSSAEQPGGATLWFRLAIAASAMALIAIVIARVDNGAAPLTAADERESSADAAQDNKSEATTPEFEHLLVDGMELDTVQRPFDPEQAEDGDDFLDRIFGPGEEVELPAPRRISLPGQIFGTPGDPFNNPIIGIENLEDGAFRPFGANLGSETLETYSNLLTKQNDTWVIDPESDLTMLDSADGHPFDGIKFGWEFEFRDGAKKATLLVEPSHGRGVWVWLHRTLRSGETGLSLIETEVLGNPGVVVSGFTEGPDVDHVYWADDDHVYRLIASTVDGHDVNDGLSSALVPRLVNVDETTWQAAVSDAESSSNVPTGIAVVLLLVVLAAATQGYRRLAR